MKRIWLIFFFSSRRRHTRSLCDWSSDVCSSDLETFDLPALAAPTPMQEIPDVRTPPRPAPAAHLHEDPQPKDAGGDDRVDDSLRAPWAPYVSAAAVPSSLGLEQRTLLGVALVLARAPLAARTSAFQRAFHGWRRHELERSDLARPPAPQTREMQKPGHRREELKRETHTI